jgi:hypothetical protein
MPRRPLPALLLAALGLLALPSVSPGDGGSFLCPPCRDEQPPPGLRVPYVPREGDLVFFAARSRLWRALFAVACAGTPTHVGIVVRAPDGHPLLLEAGSLDPTHVRVREVLPRMHDYDGPVWVRRLREPLDAEQSACLTAFAQAQSGKRYAMLRTILELTPFRTHGRVGAYVFGRPWVERRSWFCSELVVAAGAHVGLIDPHEVQPNTVYPCDLFRDERHDLSACWEEPRLWTLGAGH